MPATTPIYGLPYDSLTDPPDGAGLGQSLAEAVEAELARLDTTDLPPLMTIASVAHVSTTINAVDMTATCKAVSWGKTLSGSTFHAYAIAATNNPGEVLQEVTVSSITSTGCNVCVMRSPAATVTVYALGIGV